MYGARNPNSPCLWVEGVGILTTKGPGGHFWDIEIVYILISGIVTREYTFVKSHQAIHLRAVHSTVYTFLQINKVLKIIRSLKKLQEREWVD